MSDYLSDWQALPPWSPAEIGDTDPLAYGLIGVASEFLREGLVVPSGEPIVSVRRRPRGRVRVRWDRPGCLWWGGSACTLRPHEGLLVTAESARRTRPPEVL